MGGVEGGVRDELRLVMELNAESVQYDSQLILSYSSLKNQGEGGWL